MRFYSFLGNDLSNLHSSLMSYAFLGGISLYREEFFLSAVESTFVSVPVYDPLFI